MIAIAHHDDDLQLIEDVVCSSRNIGIYTQSLSNVLSQPRKP